uniref:Myosin motor domain-containing protein n=1 Tax=Gopherus agassizii TaxID=38772 RepID=A0A452I3X5_9SAUR
TAVEEVKVHLGVQSITGVSFISVFQVNGPKRDPAIQNELNDAFKEEVKAFLSDEDKLHLLDDLTKVNPVTTTTVLKCLQARYTVDVFYTYAGCSLVAINPFQSICRLYTPELMKEYHAALRPQELKPHIFAVAEQTYRNIESQIEPINQSIIVSGESGAGKVSVGFFFSLPPLFNQATLLTLLACSETLMWYKAFQLAL